MQIGTARSNPVTGEYKITLPAGYKYGFRAEAEGFVSVNDNIDLESASQYYEIKRNLELIPIVIGETIRLNNIFFDYNKSDLRDESYPELNRVVKLLFENPNININIQGHTDNIGDAKYNQTLSENRAKAVADYIISKNVGKDRITFQGYGSEKPLTSNDTEEGRQLNRRVEFIILE